jgi:hypothetical protein
VRKARNVILDRFVKDGQSWSKARRGYMLTLSAQTRSLDMMANWVGGSFVHRDKKGDPNGRPPVEPVPAAQQRAALKFVIDNSLDEAAFGLTPELLRHMTVDKWWDADDVTSDPTWPVHDRLLGIQASMLSALMNPTTLERVYDNEFRVSADDDALTLPELLGTLRGAIWPDLAGELGAEGAEFSARKPALSSFERNLQKEYLDRLVDLIGPDTGFNAAHKPIQNLAAMQLSEIKTSVDAVKDHEKLDDYSRAHLAETSKRIEKALDTDYVIDVAGGSSGGGAITIMIGGEDGGGGGQ